jgi:hypothetical protein
MIKHTFIYFLTGLLLTAAILQTGCRNDRLKGLVPVNGIIICNGTPLDGAAVAFEPVSGTGMAASCYTDARGKFKLTTRHPGDGIFPGDYAVSINKVTVLYMPTEEESEKYHKETGKDLGAKVRYDVPEKYCSAETSGLKYTVPGEGIKDLVIELSK